MKKQKQFARCKGERFAKSWSKRRCCLCRHNCCFVAWQSTRLIFQVGLLSPLTNKYVSQSCQEVHAIYMYNIQTCVICRMSSSGRSCLLLFCLVDACDHQSQQEVKKVDKSTKIMCAHKKMCDFQFSSMSILYHGSNSLDHSLLTGERAMSALLWTFGMHLRQLSRGIALRVRDSIPLDVRKQSQR